MRLTREASVHQKGVGARYSEVDMGASGGPVLHFVPANHPAFESATPCIYSSGLCEACFESLSPL